MRHDEGDFAAGAAHGAQTPAHSTRSMYEDLRRTPSRRTVLSRAFLCAFLLAFWVLLRFLYYCLRLLALLYMAMHFTVRTCCAPSLLRLPPHATVTFAPCGERCSFMTLAGRTPAGRAASGKRQRCSVALLKRT